MVPVGLAAKGAGEAKKTAEQAGTDSEHSK